MGGVLEGVLTGVPSWTVYLIVFVLPLVECSLFVGFLFPGETALILGGVLASGALAGQTTLSLWLLCLLASLGAIIGDSVGYAIGRRYGAAVQRSKLGLVVGPARWQAAESFLRRRGGPAVFLGRFTALLRALVPSAAGMSGLPFRTFLIWNAVGGLIWANGSVLVGYLAGESYTTIESYVGKGALVLTGLVIAVAVGVHLRRRRSHGSASTGSPGPDLDDPATSVPSGR